MQSYTNNVQDYLGNSLQGQAVLVKTAAGDVATIYADNSLTPKDNPFMAGAGGMYTFFAANGHYTITIGEDVRPFTLFDVTEAGLVPTESLAEHTNSMANPHAVTKAQVGLGSVDNIPAGSMPVSAAQLAALDLKADVSALSAHTGSTANPHSVTKSQLGLGNVSNLAPADMPVSTAQQEALDAKVASTALAANDGAALVGFDKNYVYGALEAGFQLRESSSSVNVLRYITPSLWAAILAKTSTTNVTAFIQAAIDAIPSAGDPATGSGSIYFPAGRYYHTGLIVTSRFITLHGDGQATALINTHATNTSLTLVNCERATVESMSIDGPGKSFGAGNGIELDFSPNTTITGVTVRSHGGHGVYAKNGNWGTRLRGCFIIANKLDGLNFISNNAQANTGQNGNALSVISCTIGSNDGHGIAWGAASLCVQGNDIELNGGAGVHIDSLSSTQSAFGFDISGNYLEHNLQGCVRMTAHPTRAVIGGNIEGNFMNGVYSTPGSCTALVYGSCPGGFAEIRDVVVGVNCYIIAGAILTHHVDILQASVGTTVQRMTAGASTLYRVSGLGRVLDFDRTVRLSNMGAQVGFVKSSSVSDYYRTGNTIAALTGVYAMPVNGGDRFKRIQSYIDTDCTSCTVTITVLQVSTTSSGSPSAVASNAFPLTGSSAINWDVEASGGAVALNGSSYFVRLAISAVVGGTTLQVRDPIVTVR